MSISRKTLIKKMKEEVAHAERHLDTDQFSVYIGKLHVLCELVLDQSNDYEEKEQLTMRKTPLSEPEERKPSTLEEPELLEGDSIFDF